MIASGQDLQQFGDRATATFHRWWNDPRSDQSAFEQAQVVLREIEDFIDLMQFGFGAEIGTHQSQYWAIDNPQVRFYGRPRFTVSAVDPEIDRCVEYLGSLGKIHTEKKDITPSRVGEIHAHTGSLGCDRVVPGLGVRLQ